MASLMYTPMIVPVQILKNPKSLMFCLIDNKLLCSHKSSLMKKAEQPIQDFFHVNLFQEEFKLALLLRCDFKTGLIFFYFVAVS